MNLDFFKQFSKIDIIGHATADFDTRLSCHLIEYILTKHGVDAKVIVPDGLDDVYFVEKSKEFNFNCEYSINFRDDSVLILVDHVANYPKRIIACFDHHPNVLPDVMPNIDYYFNVDKTCCALLIYEMFEAIGETFPDVLTKLTVFDCYMDSLSFKSSKALPEDHVWSKQQIDKFGFDEAKIVRFGYGLTDQSLPFSEYVRTGTKVYEVNGKHFGSSYIIVDDKNYNLHQISFELKRELNEDMIAWCFVVANVAQDFTTVMLITDEGVKTRTVWKLLSRGKDIVSAVRSFLMANYNI